jgi:hypothetical protein
MADPILDPWATPSATGSTNYSVLFPQRQPDGGQSFQDRILNRARQARQQITQAAETNIPRMRAAVKGAPLGRIGTFGTAGLLGYQQLAQGDTLGAAAEAVGSLGGSAIAATLGRGLMAAPGPLGIAARVGIPIVGGLIGGKVAGGFTGAVGAKAQEPTAEPIYIPGTNIPLNQAAQYENLRNRDLAYQLRASKAASDQDLAVNRQYMADARNDEILRNKAMLPMMEQIQRSNLVNAQAMLASQTASYQQLGRTAGMFKLAQGAQAETGATLRTAISNNPYIGATLSAPSISFG